MDNTIYMLMNGKMTKIGSLNGRVENTNFLIRCEYGDWSGFRTLKECESQFSELEQKGKSNGFFSVVER